MGPWWELGEGLWEPETELGELRDGLEENGGELRKSWGWDWRGARGTWGKLGGLYGDHEAAGGELGRIWGSGGSGEEVGDGWLDWGCGTVGGCGEMDWDSEGTRQEEGAARSWIGVVGELEGDGFWNREGNP